MSTTSAEALFAAQFASLAVAVAGVLLVALRRRSAAGGPGGGPVVPAARAGRLALALGLAGVAAAAALDGLQVAADGRATASVRLVAGLAVAVGSRRWRRATAASVAVALGGLAWAATGVVGLVAAGSGGGGVVADAVDATLIGGALAVGAGLLGASRSSVAARIAAASAAALLAVVLVLSAALGSVITSALQGAQLRSLTGRAGVEVAELSATTATAVEDARFAAADLSAVLGSAQPDPLVGGPPAPVAAQLGRLAALYPVGGFAYVGSAGEVVATGGALTAATATALATASGLQGDGCSNGGAGGVVPASGLLWAAATFPVCQATRPVGAVVRAVPFDGAYLAGRRAADPATAVLLASATGPVVVGGAVDPAAVADARTAALTPAARVVGHLAVAVQPVPGPGPRPVGALVVASALASQVAARTRLLHALFIVSVGGTVLALLLAALVGDRITAGVRRLTGAAARVQAGDTTARAGVGGDDEVGELGNAFDAMVVSIEEQTLALERAAADEAALRGRLEAVVAGMGEALVAVDAGGRVTDFNRAAVALTGVARAAAVGAAIDDLFDLVDEQGRPVLPMLVGADRTGVRGVVATLVAAPGAGVPVAATAGSLTGAAGEPAGAVLVLRDLRAEQTVERMKSEFLSRIGHELRTPLTGVIGYAQLLARYGDDVPAGRGPQFAGEILSSARRLLRVIEMLEFVAGTGAGRLTLRREQLDVAELVDQVVDSWADRAPAGTPVRRRVGRRLPAVEGDRRWLALAVDELVDNAVKFSPDGGPVDVRAAAIDGGDGPAVEITVRDRGKGMTADEQEAAFTEFAQGDGSDTRSYGGLGLGLAIVARVVDGQGGTVRCSSAPGRGSTFSIRLPVAVSES
ncbi:MAG TPA: ATP-binding protein [Acidimicrobiales bacterium]|nr:ATP-binding protein [Acidimicrobiales bacterium]